MAAASVSAVLLAGGAATAAMFTAAQHSADQTAGQLMDRYADDLTTAITDQVSRYSETLTDMAYAVAAQSSLRAIDFSRITAGLNADRFPGATGVAYVVPSTTAQTHAIQQRWRGQGADGLVLAPAAGVTEHEFVIFDKPFTDGTDLHGVDLQNSPQATVALRTARQSGTIAISPAYQLLRDQSIPAAERQTSVVLAAPVSTGLGSDDPDVFHGWIVMGLHGQDFLARTLLDRTHSIVQATLTDPAGAGTGIATVTPGTRLPDDRLDRDQTIAVGQRRWHISVWPTNRLTVAAHHSTATMTLGAGAALTVMLAILTATTTGSRNRALDQVDRATAALREDITRRESIEAQLREREEQLQHLAFHDPLTGLANRLLFHEQVTKAITQHTGGSTFAVLFVDLDGFKPINDAFGHHAGDHVLRITADRLREAVRADDTVARLGGDEFAVIIEHLAGEEEAHASAARVVAALGAPIDLAGTTVSVSASLGIAVSGPATTADDVLRRADEAMYAAKSAGKGRYVLVSA